MIEFNEKCIKMDYLNFSAENTTFDIAKILNFFDIVVLEFFNAHHDLREKRTRKYLCNKTNAAESSLQTDVSAK